MIIVGGSWGGCRSISRIFSSIRGLGILVFLWGWLGRMIEERGGY